MQRPDSALRLASLGFAAASAGGVFLLVAAVLIVSPILSSDGAYVAIGGSLLAYFVVVAGALLGLASLVLSRVAWLRVCASLATLMGVTALEWALYAYLVR
jgi:hypothetical protein